MDRTLVYPSEQPTDTLWLTAERNKMLAIGYLAQGMLGTSTAVDGLGCIPTVPASLAVQVLPGSIYQQEPVDSSSYASLGIDTVDQVIKQGIIQPITSLTLTPPGTAGQALNYLIEASILEQDAVPIVLSYFNSANPSIPFTGPGGSGTSQPTIRQCTLSLVAKAGVAATAGSQVTPAPDAGYVGLWVVVVANGATALTSAQISQYPAAPFISVKLPQVPTWVQGGTWDWATDTGTANQIIVTMNPVPPNIPAGFTIKVKKASPSSTGGMTIIVNGAPAVAVVNTDGSALTSAIPMNAGFLAELTFDGTAFRWTNPFVATAVGSLGASSGEGITVSGAGSVALNYPGLSVEPVLANTDLWSFFSQADTHHRVLSFAQLLGALRGFMPPPLLNVRLITATSTYTPFTSGLFTARANLVVLQGPGGGGGAATGGGGGAGALSFWYGPAVSTPVTIGLGGAGGVVGNGLNGSGPSLFGTVASADFGKGGGLGHPNQPGINLGIFGSGGSAGASTGLFSVNGNNGDYGKSAVVTLILPSQQPVDGGDWPGLGGAGFLGGGGNPGGGTGTYGSGGGGGIGYLGSGTPGGRGGDGYALILEF
jgi:hypothetical protein